MPAALLYQLVYRGVAAWPRPPELLRSYNHQVRVSGLLVLHKKRKQAS